MSRRIISIWLSLAMVLSFVVIVDVIINITPTMRGITLYVNTTGDGGAYTKIQDAIDNASEGNTVFVYNGTYNENVVVNKTINLTGENRNTTIIDGSGADDVIYITVNWVNITGFTITRSGSLPEDAGIKLHNVQNCGIKNNNFPNNHYSIYVNQSSSNNIIAGNEINNSYYGIRIRISSNNNVIINNTALNSDMAGICIIKSSRNKLINNNASSNNDGISLWDAANYNIIENNKILSSKERGIELYKSHRNNITDNTVSSSGIYGVHLYSSSTNNRVYHNIITDNIMGQAYDTTSSSNQWDNGYPSGGNYWSNYGGVDNFKGPEQDIPGSDGIGDSRYSVDPNTYDRYPLMEPYTPLENYTILKQGWNLISIPLIQEKQNLTKILEMIDSYYNTVEWYDITNKDEPWKIYNIDKYFGNDIYELNETMGFWIYINQPGDTIFLYNGTQPTSNQTITLHPGWNMVGYPSQTIYNRTAALNNLTFGTHVDSIWTFDAATQKWKDLGPSDYFKPGRGYWISTKVECTWEVPL